MEESSHILRQLEIVGLIRKSCFEEVIGIVKYENLSKDELSEILVETLFMGYMLNKSEIMFKLIEILEAKQAQAHLLKTLLSPIFDLKAFDRALYESPVFGKNVALSVAVSSNEVDLVRKLLAAGADATANHNDALGTVCI